jgi:hypothetical protein
MAELIQIYAILGCCGFNAANQIEIAQDRFNSFADIAGLEIKDVDRLSKGFAARTVANGKKIFGMRRTMRLKGMVHWVQDFGRVSREAAVDEAPDVVDAATFLAALDVARDRAKMRKHELEESDDLSKAADPGKLKKQKDWMQWERGFNNFLSTIPGQSGIPLNCVIRENENPSYENKGDDDFDQLCVEAAALTGMMFQADSRKVHQLITGLVHGEAAETWIKSVARRRNGRMNFRALTDHYGGAGNKSVRIKEAEVLRRTLTYKNERAMSFEKFITNMNLMFVAHAENEEVMSEDQKIRLLFKKTSHPSLETVKSLLQVAENLDQTGAVNYEFIVNSISAEVANLSDFVPNRNTSGVGTQGTGGAPANGVVGADGKVFTGFYKNFSSLLADDKQAIFDERKRLGTTPSKSRRGSCVRAGRSAPGSAIKAKNKQVDTLQGKIVSLKAKVAAADGGKKRDASEDEDSVMDNAGDQFGGRSEKKNKKQKK